MGLSLDLIPHGTIVPRLFRLDPGEMDAASADVTIPNTLRDVWRDFGYGFFTHRADGTAATEFANRLLSPSQIEEARDEHRIDEDNPFGLGTPFFETVDSTYLIVTPSGAVVEPDGGTNVAPYLRSFFRRLLDDPEFWLGPSDGSGNR